MSNKNSKACTCAACLRVLAGQVKFCPFCGIGQSQAARAATVPAKPVDVPRAPTNPLPSDPQRSPPAPEPAPAAAPAASAVDKAAAVKRETAAKIAAEQKATEESAAALAAVAEAAGKKVRGKKAAESSRPAGDGDSGGSKKRVGVLAKLFWIGVALLVVFWLKGKMLNNDTQRVAQEGLERQTTSAMSLAEACKLDEARAALRALDEAKGTPQQHATVQKAISDAAPGCAKQVRQDAAWADAKVTIERAVGNQNFDRANNTLKNFTAQWGEDDASRAMRDLINAQNVNGLLGEAETCLKAVNLDCTTKNVTLAQTLDQGDAKVRIAGIQAALAAARELAAVPAANSADAPVGDAPPIRVVPQVRPAPLPAASAVPMIPVPAPTSAPDPRLATLVNDAAKRMHEGNYRGAEDLMSMCVSLDPNNRRCQEMRQRANQMNRTMLSCVASGKEWVNERCD